MALHKINAIFHETNSNEQYALEIEAKYGSSHETSYYNAEGLLVLLNNNNNSGTLGKGNELIGKTIIIRSNAENNTPDIYNDKDQISLEYFIKSNIEKKKIAEYDKPEDDDDYPSIKLKISFE